MKRVAIIGAGSAGIAAGKACKEDEIDFVIFEKTGTIAGLWSYREEDVNGEASVMKTTVINSSKEISTFSDFPPPKEFPNYMHHRYMWKYFHMYAEKFKLLDHIRYYQEVTNVIQSPDYDESGRWIVTAQNTKDKTETMEIFDGVMVCTGHHGYPYIPKFPGQENYLGKIVHAHSVRVPDAFKDQKVAIVGVGNSGLDAAVDISNVAEQVYLSTRRGAWIVFRLGYKGLPIDVQTLTRFAYVLLGIVGYDVANWVGAHLFIKFNHEIYNLKPKHGLFAQHVTVNDHIPNKILSGRIIVKNNIEKFCEKGVIFQGDENITNVDSVVMATGYNIKFPFISPTILDTTNNNVNLYKFMFPPHLKHPSLVFIGLVQPYGALYPIFEVQSRWYAQLLNGKVKLPDYETMINDIGKAKKIMSERYVATQRHTVQVDYVTYMDEIASQFGVKPNLLKMAFTDPILFYHCFFGPCTPYQYRLCGPHSWPEARHTILTTRDRILFPLNTRNKRAREDFRKGHFAIWILFSFIFCFVIFLVYTFV